MSVRNRAAAASDRAPATCRTRSPVGCAVIWRRRAEPGRLWPGEQVTGCYQGANHRAQVAHQPRDRTGRLTGETLVILDCSDEPGSCNVDPR